MKLRASARSQLCRAAWAHECSKGEPAEHRGWRRNKACWNEMQTKMTGCCGEVDSIKGGADGWHPLGSAVSINRSRGRIGFGRHSRQQAGSCSSGLSGCGWKTCKQENNMEHRAGAPRGRPGRSISRQGARLPARAAASHGGAHLLGQQRRRRAPALGPQLGCDPGLGAAGHHKGAGEAALGQLLGNCGWGEPRGGVSLGGAGLTAGGASPGS